MAKKRLLAQNNEAIDIWNNKGMTMIKLVYVRCLQIDRQDAEQMIT